VAVRPQQRVDAPRGGQPELGVLVQGQADVVHVVGECPYRRREMVLVRRRVVEEPGQSVRVGVW
jgi:hypothetical protein